MLAILIIFWSCFGVMAYAHLFYPLLMLILAKTRRADTVEDGRLPTVSLIIPAYNEGLILDEKLRNSLRIDYPKDKLQIIVASDGSGDDTVTIANRYLDDGVTLLSFQERRGKASVVNDAVARAEGEVICFCDANVMFDPQAIRRLAARLNDPMVGLASGDVQLQSHQSNFEHGESLYYRVERSLQLSESRFGSSMGAEGGMFVIRREAFKPLRPDTILDDLVIMLEIIRGGGRAVHEPSATAVEDATPLARNEFWRRVRVTAGAIQVLKRRQWPPLRRPTELMQFVSHKILRWLGPIWLLAIAVTSILLWETATVYKVAVVAQALLYGTAIMAALVPALRHNRFAGIAFYFTMSHAAMALGIIGGVFNLQSVRWNRTERTTDLAESYAKAPPQNM